VVAAVGVEAVGAGEAGPVAAADVLAVACRGPAVARGPAAESRAVAAGAPRWAACRRCRAPLEETVPAATSPARIDRAAQIDKQWADSRRREIGRQAESIDLVPVTLPAIGPERETSPGIGRTLAREEPETGRTFRAAGQLKVN